MHMRMLCEQQWNEDLAEDSKRCGIWWSVGDASSPQISKNLLTPEMALLGGMCKMSAWMTMIVMIRGSGWPCSVYQAEELQVDTQNSEPKFENSGFSHHCRCMDHFVWLNHLREDFMRERKHCVLADVKNGYGYGWNVCTNHSYEVAWPGLQMISPCGCWPLSYCLLHCAILKKIKSSFWIYGHNTIAGQVL